MTRRLLVPLLLVVLALSACRPPASVGPGAGASCSPPPGGRCASDVAWRGPLQISDYGLRLHGPLVCGGTLRADETADRVTITLHLTRMGPGTMLCARVDVGVRLHAALGDRIVVDAVSGRTVRVL